MGQEFKTVVRDFDALERLLAAGPTSLPVPELDASESVLTTPAPQEGLEKEAYVSSILRLPLALKEFGQGLDRLQGFLDQEFGHIVFRFNSALGALRRGITPDKRADMIEAHEIVVGGLNKALDLVKRDIAIGKRAITRAQAEPWAEELDFGRVEKTMAGLSRSLAQAETGLSLPKLRAFVSSIDFKAFEAQVESVCTEIRQAREAWPAIVEARRQERLAAQAALTTGQSEGTETPEVPALDTVEFVAPVVPARESAPHAAIAAPSPVVTAEALVRPSPAPEPAALEARVEVPAVSTAPAPAAAPAALAKTEPETQPTPRRKRAAAEAPAAQATDTAATPSKKAPEQQPILVQAFMQAVEDWRPDAKMFRGKAAERAVYYAAVRLSYHDGELKPEPLSVKDIRDFLHTQKVFLTPTEIKAACETLSKIDGRLGYLEKAKPRGIQLTSTGIGTFITDVISTLRRTHPQEFV